jgi:uncharacterized membrane-anchored protein YjiN (DUF445 family)
VEWLARRDASDTLDLMDITIDAPSRTRDGFSFTNFFLMHKGDLTLAFSALVYLVSLAALMFTHWRTSSEIAVSMAEAALIGGLCDYIALKMIFERRWYLPNSGVLPRNRAKLIDGIAATIENEWLTPQMIGRKLSDMDLVGRLGTYLQELTLNDILGQAGLERLISNAIDYLDSPEKRERLEKVLKRMLPKTVTRIYAVMSRFGAESIGARIAANLRKRLPELQNDPELRDTIESAIHEFGIQLHDPESYANQFAQRLIDNLVRRTVESSRGQITQMVRENLARLSDDQIRIQIESKTRTHLDWIRVNGGLFGAFFGLMFALSRILSHNGPAILAHFHIAM